MASNGSNGKAAPAAGVVVPEIKFTKLFINGEFVDAASGTVPFHSFLLHSQL
jgi:coniferyl-aldehyde dehydrogenase